jgi:formate--tetrahydrofolate ligase
VIDFNDRSLREIIIGLGGVKHGVPRKDGFNITPASEIMAILCLSKDFIDLGRRLSNMVIAFTYDGKPVRPTDILAVGAMQVLLRDAINPNIVQTLEGTPAFVHAGPFANIAHGTSTAVATRMALKCAEYVAVEAGFGTDLGAEKFFHIKCRSAGLKPSAVVIVATVRSIQYHGGFNDRGGLGNLAKHIENIRHFGVEPVVAINRFDGDTKRDFEKIVKFCGSLGVDARVATHYSDGGEGAKGLAESVIGSIRKNQKRAVKYLYSMETPIEEKIGIIAKKMYGADGVNFDSEARADLEIIKKHGFDRLSVCIAKTPLSLSDDQSLRGRPSGFKITVNKLRISSGAGFIVAICGNIVTMPGLPKIPTAAKIKILKDGSATGLS